MLSFRRFVHVFLLLAALLTPALARQPLVVAEAGQPIYALLYLAASKDYFDDAGVEVILRRYPSSEQALEAVLRGEAQLAAAPTPVVTAQVVAGAPLGILSLLHLSTRSTALVARADAGIDSPADLAGKRVGLSGEAGSRFFLDTLLVSAGVRPPAVTYVELPTPCLAGVFERARVDAVIASGACIHRLREQRGTDAVAVFYSDVYTDMSVLVGRRAFIDGEEARLVAVLTALERAERFIRQYPRQSLRSLMRALPEQAGPALRQSWGEIEPRLGLSQLLLEQLQQEGDWLLTDGVGGRPLPEFRQFLIPEFLQRVDPRRVTVY